MFELLSPAGSMESLKAGIQNGADAIYLGGSSFGARASATNFDNDELIEAVKYAKLRNVNIFVTVNTSIKETEVEELISLPHAVALRMHHVFGGIILLHQTEGVESHLKLDGPEQDAQIGRAHV